MGDGIGELADRERRLISKRSETASMASIASLRGGMPFAQTMRRPIEGSPDRSAWRTISSNARSRAASCGSTTSTS
jgi:hypothetical protein